MRPEVYADACTNAQGHPDQHPLSFSAFLFWYFGRGVRLINQQHARSAFMCGCYFDREPARFSVHPVARYANLTSLIG